MSFGVRGDKPLLLLQPPKYASVHCCSEWQLVFNIKVPSFPSIVQHTIIILIVTIMDTTPSPLFSKLVSGSGFSLEEIKSILKALVPDVRGNTLTYISFC